MGRKRQWYLAVVILIGCVPFLCTGIEILRGMAPVWYDYEMTENLLNKDADWYETGEITKDRIVQQSFVARSDSILSISILAGTYARNNSGLLHIRLIDTQTNNTVGEWDKNMEELSDQSCISVGFQKEEIQSGMYGREYLLELTAPCAKEGNAVTLYAFCDDPYEDGELWIDGEKQPGDLKFLVDGTSARNYASARFWLRFYAAGLLETIVYVVYKSQEGRREKGSFCKI